MTRAMIIILLMLATPVFAAGPQPSVGGKIAPVVLSDADGRAVDISRFLGTHPLLVVPVYFRCPNICSLSVSNLLNALEESRLIPGRDLDVVVFSFNPAEGPKDAAAFGSQARAEVPAFATAPLHFLTGSAAATTPLLASLGAGAVVDATTGQFAHPAAVAVVAPDGRVTAWLSTLSITSADLRGAVDAARSDRTFSLRDFIVTCFHGVVSGAHAATIRNALRIAGVLTIVLILAGVTWLVRRRERQS